MNPSHHPALASTSEATWNKKNTNNPTSTSSSSSSTHGVSSLTCILGNAFEVILHEILYISKLYPKDVFTTTRYLGITCHACRHPGVVTYIHETLLVAIPSILEGCVDELILLFYDDEHEEEEEKGRQRQEQQRIYLSTHILQRFIFSLDVDSVIQAKEIFQKDEEIFTDSIHNKKKKKKKKIISHTTGIQNEEEEERKEEDESLLITKTVTQRIQDVERCMRDVLLKIISMESSTTTTAANNNTTNFTDTTTFKICLHKSIQYQKKQQQQGKSTVTNNGIDMSRMVDMEDDDHPQQQQKQAYTLCDTLQQALNQGLWTCPEESTCEQQQQQGVKVRPLRGIHVPSCGFSMQVLMESSSSL